MIDGPLAKVFLWGACAMACGLAGLFFLRFWRETADRFFALLALAFWIFGADWVLLAVLSPPQESRHVLYLLRLLAFLVIIVAVLDKNRRQPRG